MISAIWMSYDLGVSGDYEGLYSWLADQGAKECGSSVAYLNFEYEEDLMLSLEEELQEAVEMDYRSRIYVIFNDHGKLKGCFLVGKRNSAPWTGYGSIVEQDYDEGR